jgi:hypothetical protein
VPAAQPTQADMWVSWLYFPAGQLAQVLDVAAPVAAE